MVRDRGTIRRVSNSPNQNADVLRSSRERERACAYERKKKKNRTEARTAHYRIVRAISLRCATEIYSHYCITSSLLISGAVPTLRTNKQTKKKKKTQMRAKATPITKGMKDVLRRKSEGREKAASDAKRAAGRRDFAVYREDATLPHPKFPEPPRSFDSSTYGGRGKKVP